MLETAILQDIDDRTAGHEMIEVKYALSDVIQGIQERMEKIDDRIESGEDETDAY